jgi:hypothetical protein
VLLPEWIPERLKAIPAAWCVWKPERKPGESRVRKVPYNLRTGRRASTTNDAGWCDFDEALAAYRAGGWHGIGYRPLPEHGVTVFDLDNCCGRFAIGMADWAVQVRDDLGGYTEVTCSGHGLRIIVAGAKPDHEHFTTGGLADWKGGTTGQVEVYDGRQQDGSPGGRFVVVTGDRLDNLPAAVEPRPEAIATVYRRFWPEAAAADTPNPDGNGEAPAGPGLTDEDVLCRAWAAFQARGAHYPSASESDLAFCNDLVYFAGRPPDPQRVRRLFLRSPLARPKSEGRPDYLAATIRVACQKDRFYRPSGVLGETAPLAAPGGPGEPFPVDCLPGAARLFVEQSAEAIGVPAAAVALPVLAVLAGMIGTKTRVLAGGDFVQPAVLWTCVVGESGTGKSPAYRAAVRPVWELERELRQEDGTGRFFTSDITVEKLIPLLAKNPDGVLLGRDELGGWVRSFDQYKPRGGSDLQNWLSMYDADYVVKDRVTGDGSLFVTNAAASICGGAQPGPFAKLMTRFNREAGLLARLMMTLLPVRARVWTGASTAAPAVAAYATLVRDLRLDDRNRGCLALAGDARDLWADFFNSH